MPSSRDLFYPKHKPIRRPTYDYSQSGAYFITICVHPNLRRKNVFSIVEDQISQLNPYGRLVRECWYDIPNHRHNVQLDAFVIMPNHVHGIIFLEGPEQTDIPLPHFGPLEPNSLPTVVGGFKSAVSNVIGQYRRVKTSAWQRRFFDRIIRDENELTNVRRYIENNPANWFNDRCHPDSPNFDEIWTRRQDPDAFPWLPAEPTQVV